MSFLTVMELLPLVGAALIATVGKEKVDAIKKMAFITTLLVAVAGIALALQFDRTNAGLQFVEKREWIPAFGINYAVGIDGIALVLILMSVILAPVVVLAGWNEATGGRWSVKNYLKNNIMETY